MRTLSAYVAETASEDDDDDDTEEDRSRHVSRVRGGWEGCREPVELWGGPAGHEASQCTCDAGEEMGGGVRRSEEERGGTSH